MKSWLDRCESVCCPDTDLLSADKVKLRNELLNVQVSRFSTPCLFLTNHPFAFWFIVSCGVFICPFSFIFTSPMCCIILKYLFTHTGNAEGDTVLWRSPPGSCESRAVSVPYSAWSSYPRAQWRSHTNTGEIHFFEEQHITQAIYFLYIIVQIIYNCLSLN